MLTTPCLSAIFAILSVSATAICGFERLSKNIAFVLSSIKPSKSSALSLSKVFVLMPKFFRVLCNKAAEPP